MRIGKDLVAAAATPLVLGILADGESYGYAILQKVSEVSAGELAWSDGMLYPFSTAWSGSGSSSRAGWTRPRGVAASSTA